MNNNTTILIVDDIPKNIQMAMNILKNEGYNMLFAQSGTAAFDIVRENDIDLILLDIMMPELNGFEVCEVLKKDDNAKDIPILFLSGKDSTEDVERAYEVGGLDYILKPFINIELITKVATFTRLRELEKSQRK